MAPHRPEDTESAEPKGQERPGEVRNPAIERGHDGPRPTADTQPPRPGRRTPRDVGAGERR